MLNLPVADEISKDTTGTGGVGGVVDHHANSVNPLNTTNTQKHLIDVRKGTSRPPSMLLRPNSAALVAPQPS